MDVASVASVVMEGSLEKVPLEMAYGVCFEIADYACCSKRISFWSFHDQLVLLQAPASQDLKAPGPD
jgi:hypothetical protein